MTDSQSRPVLKYIGLFALAYIILLPIVTTVLSLIAVHMGGIYYSIIFGAASVPVYLFRKENGRLYSKEEKRKLVLGTFLCAMIIDMIDSTRGKLSIFESRSVFVVSQIVNLIVLWLIFGPLSKNLYKRSDQSN